MLAKFFPNNIFVGFEGDVSNEEGIAWLAGLITEGFSPIVGLVLISTSAACITTRLSKVYVDLTVVDLASLHGIMCLCGIFNVDILDVAKPGSLLAS